MLHVPFVPNVYTSEVSIPCIEIVFLAIFVMEMSVVCFIVLFCFCVKFSFGCNLCILLFGYFYCIGVKYCISV